MGIFFHVANLLHECTGCESACHHESLFPSPRVTLRGGMYWIVRSGDRICSDDDHCAGVWISTGFCRAANTALRIVRSDDGVGCGTLDLLAECAVPGHGSHRAVRYPIFDAGVAGGLFKHPGAAALASALPFESHGRRD